MPEDLQDGRWNLGHDLLGNSTTFLQTDYALPRDIVILRTKFRTAQN